MLEAIAAALREDGIHCRVDNPYIDCWSSHMRWWIIMDDGHLLVGLYLEGHRKPWHAHFDIADPDVF